MMFRIAFACLAVFFAHNAIIGFQPQKKEGTAAFSFSGVEYFHRFTKDDQREYTPRGQEDLKA